MSKRYFRKKDPNCKAEDTEWIEMTGKEFYRFVTDPENKRRFFIDMDDVVLESSEEAARAYRTEKDHSDYLKEQEAGWSILSLHALEEEVKGGGESILRDETQDVEAFAISSAKRRALHAALKGLDNESFLLIHALYLANERKTESEIASERGISQNAIHKRKKKILKNLKILVVKLQKSSQ